MSPPQLSPVTEGTRWPSGQCVDLALLPLSEDDLAARIGLPLVRGVEDGLGPWAGIGASAVWERGRVHLLHQETTPLWSDSPSGQERLLFYYS